MQREDVRAVERCREMLSCWVRVIVHWPKPIKSTTRGTPGSALDFGRLRRLGCGSTSGKKCTPWCVWGWVGLIAEAALTWGKGNVGNFCVFRSVLLGTQNCSKK